MATSAESMVLAQAANQRGIAFARQGRLDEAKSHFHYALTLQPDDIDIHQNLANLLIYQGQFDDAVKHCQITLRLRPDHVEAYYMLGFAWQNLGKCDDALACYRQAVRLKPDHVDAQHGLGIAFLSQNRWGEAQACFRSVLRLKPNHLDARNSLGSALLHEGDCDQAVLCFQQVLQVNPGHLNALNNLGLAFMDQGKFEQAAGCFQRALQNNACFVAAYCNLGSARTQQCRFDEALACYDEALRLNSQDGLAHYNRSLLWLMHGKFELGWREWEWRFTQAGFICRSFAQPVWDGSELEGRTILLHSDQGLGDTLQFIRYAPLIKSLGAHVIVECQPTLLPLLRNVAGVDQLLGRGETLPPFDVHAEVLSLPGLLGSTLATIPAVIPYLHADAKRVEYWRRELEPFDGLKIGINWQGSPVAQFGQRRSIPLKQFCRLAKLEGVHLISLQKGPGREEMRATAAQFPVHDLGDRLDEDGAFVDTAAILMNLDMVITCDTSIAHLAGALGVRVWLALLLVPDWRWMLGREDSPWYPTMKLVRQKTFGRWEDVFDRIAQEVNFHAASTVRLACVQNKTL